MAITYGTEKGLFTILDADANDLGSVSDAIMEIRRRKYDGLIIRNVFSETEVEDFRRRIAETDRSWIVSTPEGLTIPGTYTVSHDESKTNVPVDSHFTACTAYTRGFAKAYGESVLKRVELMFRSISGGREVATPSAPGDQTYPPDSIRVLFPYRGGIQMHCENYLYSLFPSASADLSSQLDLMDGLSYWILLSKPDSGGELTMFDLEWDSVKDNLDSRVTFNENGKIDLVDRDSLQSMKISVNEGDMFLFAAGQIWHRIENISGIKSRVTLGGFIGFSRDDKTIFRWS